MRIHRPAPPSKAGKRNGPVRFNGPPLRRGGQGEFPRSASSNESPPNFIETNAVMCPNLSDIAYDPVERGDVCDPTPGRSFGARNSAERAS